MILLSARPGIQARLLWFGKQTVAFAGLPLCNPHSREGWSLFYGQQKWRWEVTCPDSVRSRITAPGNHRHENPPYALHPGGAFLSAGWPVSCWVRAESSHLLHNTQSEVGLNWCKPVRRGAITCTHEMYETGPFPGLREAATEVSWVGGMMRAIGLVERTGV